MSLPHYKMHVGLYTDTQYVIKNSEINIGYPSPETLSESNGSNGSKLLFYMAMLSTTLRQHPLKQSGRLLAEAAEMTYSIVTWRYICSPGMNCHHLQGF